MGRVQVFLGRVALMVNVVMTKTEYWKTYQQESLFRPN